MHVQASDDNADTVSSPSSSTNSSASSSGQSSSGLKGGEKKKPELRKYIESFDKAMMVQMASVVSREGLNVLERQTKALWGDAKLLQEQMQEVCFQTRPALLFSELNKLFFGYFHPENIFFR